MPESDCISLILKIIKLIFIKTLKSSIADALPFPDAIDEPENLTANLNATSQNENDENVISNLISALSTHSRPPIQSGLRQFSFTCFYREEFLRVVRRVQ